MVLMRGSVGDDVPRMAASDLRFAASMDSLVTVTGWQSCYTSRSDNSVGRDITNEVLHMHH
jgi:hypothetical protein